MATYKIHGITDEVTACDCCGKSGLVRTVALENEAGNIRYFGTTCAARAMKQRGRRDVIVDRAKRLNRIRPVADAVAASMHAGIESAIQAGRLKAAELDISGKEITVSGYASWGLVNVDGFCARIQVPLN